MGRAWLVQEPWQCRLIEQKIRVLVIKCTDKKIYHRARLFQVVQNASPEAFFTVKEEYGGSTNNHKP